MKCSQEIIEKLDPSQRSNNYIYSCEGDFNWRLGTLGYTEDSIIQGPSLNGERLSLDITHIQSGKTVLEFFASNGFTLLNGRTPSDTPGHFTFSNKNGQSVVDLTWVNNDGLHLVKDMWVDELVFKSDHFPITIEIYPNYNAITAESEFDQRAARPIQYKLCWKKDKKNTYKHLMAWSPRVTGDFTHSYTDVLCNNLYSAILDAANEGLPIQPIFNPSKRVFRKPWYNTECAAAKDAVKASLAQCKASQQRWSIYHDIKAEYYTLLRNRRSEFELQIRKKFRNVRNAVEFWSVVNSARKTVLQPSQILLEQWESFYRGIYLQFPAPDYLYLGPSDPLLDEDITLEELIHSLTKSRLGKAPGADGIPNEFYKALPNNWKLYPVVLFNKILRTGSTPIEWSHIIMCMLHKKGDPLNPNNYRSIALVNSLEKIFTQIIHERIRTWANSCNIICEEQAGFQSGRGCEDNFFSLLALLQMQLRFKDTTTYALCIDFKRAFDSVPRLKLWENLIDLGLSPKCVNLLMKLYEQLKMRVRNNGNLSDFINITESVLQGEVFSPLLFCLYISDIVRFFKKKGAEGLFAGLTEVLLLLYADDIVLVVSTEVRLRKSLAILEEYCRVKSLTVNTDETQILACKATGRTPRIRSKFMFNGKELSVVSNYEYLGTKICTSLKGNLAATYATKKGKSAIGTVLNITKNFKGDSWLDAVKLHNSIARATVTYLAHLSCLSLDCMEQPETSQLYFYKRLLSLPMCTPGYAIRLELNLDQTAVCILKAAINWIIKVLRTHSRTQASFNLPAQTRSLERHTLLPS
ncbi:uncharacterized protein LOC124310242 [Neodiprion virginianus]|uniref:uncharacterized protein LOC124310242 n=1 Tax=Neodiprion virginianus TaxID=2961670 RepID=UPI001EE6ACA1|nr:uncharacterized protein LOC124310242 [Neodiprion virginianus]